MSSNENTAPIDRQGKKRRRTKWSSLSYATRLTTSFAAVAAMTALVAIGVISFVWEQTFQAYTTENIQSLANVTARRIQEDYQAKQAAREQAKGQTVNEDEKKLTAEETEARNKDEKEEKDKDLKESAISYGIVASMGFQSVEVKVVKNDEEGSVLYDSTTYALGGEGSSLPSLEPTSEQTKSASIVVDGNAIGYVRIWVKGADTFLSSTDEAFRDNTYQALVFASILAIILAMCLGFLFARNLVNPINRMTRTAQAIKEGDLSARTKLTGDDEIARLGETFDEMAESVQQDRELERRLTTDVAHELRTPLMAIQATVEAMVDGVFIADTERLETVNSEVERLSRLVDALLRLSRLENRNTPIKKEVIDVGELISGIVATHEAFIVESGLTMGFQADEGVRVYGDADMIRQATANLISNAVRYTPEGGRIFIRVKQGDIMASIAVQDTGIGLTPEEEKMVFSRFWRADAGRSREYGGLGIGLTVVKEIVDRHGGWVHVEGRPNQGATFTIYIPLYDEEVERNRMKAREGKPKRN